MSTQHLGIERRRHRMYVTRNTEYHFRDGVCIAVRDLRGGKWLLGHSALNRSWSGAIRFQSAGDPYPTLSEPQVGDAMFFGTAGPEIVTSVLMAIERPTKTLVNCYPC